MLKLKFLLWFYLFEDCLLFIKVSLVQTISEILQTNSIGFVFDSSYGLSAAFMNPHLDFICKLILKRVQFFMHLNLQSSNVDQFWSEG